MESHRPITRRRVVQLLGAAALAAVPVGRLAGETSAARTWCRRDPVLKVNGEHAHAWVASTTKMKRQATGPIELIVEVPVGAVCSSSPGDNGFGFGWVVSFREAADLVATERDVPIRLLAHCPASTSRLPVLVGLEPKGGSLLHQGYGSGSANQRYVVARCQSDIPGDSAG